MIRAAALRETITVYTAAQTGAEDRYGNASLVEGTGVDVPAMVTPINETEQEINADTRVSRYRVLANPDTEIDALSRVVWRGRSFQVIGEPQSFVARRGVHHFEFDMREVQGG